MLSFIEKLRRQSGKLATTSRMIREPDRRAMVAKASKLLAEAADEIEAAPKVVRKAKPVDGVNHEALIDEAYKRGLAEGKAEGIALGKERGKVATQKRLLKVLGAA